MKYPVNNVNDFYVSNVIEYENFLTPSLKGNQALPLSGFGVGTPVGSRNCGPSLDNLSSMEY